MKNHNPFYLLSDGERLFAEWLDHEINTHEPTERLVLGGIYFLGMEDVPAINETVYFRPSGGTLHPDSKRQPGDVPIGKCHPVKNLANVDIPTPDGCACVKIILPYDGHGL